MSYLATLLEMFYVNIYRHIRVEVIYKLGSQAKPSFAKINV
jgi:hypothetical protein